MKFGRIYQASVRGQLLQHDIRFPLTVEFDIERNIFASANVGKFTFYNLNASSRSDIYFDRFVDFLYLPVSFSAGYTSQAKIPEIFRGNIRTAYTERVGSNLITRIECFDGGTAMRNSFVSITKPKNYVFSDVVRTAMSTLQKAPGQAIGIGTISAIATPSTRGITLNGNTWRELQKLVPPGGNLFIDKEVANLLAQNDVVATSDGLPVITAATGLRNVPRKMGYQVSCSITFEPRIAVCQAVTLQSQTNPTVNGAYKVVGFHHHGTISGTQGGDAVTDLALLSLKAPQPV